MIVDEHRLWQAVILRALQDAVWVDPHPTGRRGDRVAFCGAAMARTTANRLRDEAAFWLLTDEQDFATVCENAGLTPHQVREGARKIINAAPSQKAIWSANGFHVSDLRGVREPRDRRVRQERQGRVVLPHAFSHEVGGAGTAGALPERAIRNR